MSTICTNMVHTNMYNSKLYKTIIHMNTHTQCVHIQRIVSLLEVKPNATIMYLLSSD